MVKLLPGEDTLRQQGTVVEPACGCYRSSASPNRVQQPKSRAGPSVLLTRALWTPPPLSERSGLSQFLKRRSRPAAAPAPARLLPLPAQNAGPAEEEEEEYDWDAI